MTTQACGDELPVTPAATFCAAIVDEWIRAGSTAAFVAPGSRSTPLALALAERQEIALHLFHDERAAGFAALGFGLRTGRPAIALCSSGTAGTHFYAAVVEADQSAVPIIVCTADRPPELWHIGAPQTIDQAHLFGSSVRWFAEPGVPDDSQADVWRSLASRVFAEASGWSGRPGPVHLNLSFRDPLAGRPGPLPKARSDRAPWHVIEATTSTENGVLPNLAGRRGVVVAGGGTVDPASVRLLATKLGWPLLANHQSGCRGQGSVNHFDSLLRHRGFAEARRPEVLLRFGEPLASKELSQWIAGLDAEVISAVPAGRWLDPERAAHRILPEVGLAAALASSVTGEPGDEAAAWQTADAVAEKAIAAALTEAVQPTEPGVCRSVIDDSAPGTAVVISSSMPIRDVEWFAGHRDDIDVYANRGANGIDGVVSTAIGVATSGVSTTCLIGDVALLHDSTSLVGLADRPIDLTIVVIDNDGGGIFSFLPQRSTLSEDRFEQLFGTPHKTDLAGLASAHRIPVSGWTGSLAKAAGVHMLIAHTDRTANVELHARLHAAVAAGLETRRDQPTLGG